MIRFYFFKDGMQKGSADTREEAIYMIRQYQKREMHPIIRSEFSIIEGEKEFIPYLPQQEITEQLHRKRGDMER